MDSGHILLGQFPSSSGQGGGGAEPMEIGAIDGNTQCFLCRKTGHISRDCPKLMKPKQGTGGKGKSSKAKEKSSGESKTSKPTAGGRWKDKDRKRLRRFIHELGDLMKDSSEEESEDEEVESDDDSEAEADERRQEVKEQEPDF
jgi:hypothetical protein